tara:strand:+ start:405 stop:1799 length:1395 start_codon:yes stop_codon:yes gene_type:complete
MKIKLAKSEVIHFVGIGGIGMSGLALVMSRMGFEVQGSDINLNKNIERLRQDRIKIFIGHEKINISRATIIVISSAVKKNNIEVISARKRSLPIYKRGDMLGHITSLTKNIVVVGSHGKTTTTSLVSSILSSSNLDPTIINGGVLKSSNNSARLGKSNWSIVELDESDGSFLKVQPTYSIITNIDREHMDYYKSMNKLLNLFVEYINRVPPFGKSFICIDDKNNLKLIKSIKVKNFLTYGTSKKSNFCISKVAQSRNFSLFNLTIRSPGKKIFSMKKIKIPLIGLHNIRNATASIAVSLSLGIPIDIIKNGLKKFKGVQRRFNKIFDYKGSSFFDDYAHHPTEIKEVLNGVKSAYPSEKIVCIFQPHRISRLNDLKLEFVKCFKKADEVILCPIFTAGENIKLNFTYESFAKQIAVESKVRLYLIKDKRNLAKFVKHNIYGNKIVIGMGAGSISNWIKELPKFI